MLAPQFGLIYMFIIMQLNSFGLSKLTLLIAALEVVLLVTGMCFALPLEDKIDFWGELG